MWNVSKICRHASDAIDIYVWYGCFPLFCDIPYNISHGVITSPTYWHLVLVMALTQFGTLTYHIGIMWEILLFDLYRVPKKVKSFGTHFQSYFSGNKGPIFSDNFVTVSKTDRNDPSLTCNITFQIIIDQ